MKKRPIEIIVTLSLFFFCIYILFNQGNVVFTTDKTLPTFDCTSYSPYVDSINNSVTKETIEKDLLKIKKYTDCIRIYSTKNGLYVVPQIADKLNMKVLLGAWIDRVSVIENQKEIDRAITLTNNHKSVVALVLGNEVVHNNGWGKADKTKYIEYITYVKGRVSKPLAIAGFAGPLSKEPDVLRMFDIIGLHIFPYWDGVDLKKATNHIISTYERFEKSLKDAGIRDKKIAIFEYGNPWFGLSRKQNTPNLKEQREMLRSIDVYFKNRGIFANYYELFSEKRIDDADGYLFRLWGTLTHKGIDIVDLQKRKYVVSLFAVGILWFLFSRKGRGFLFKANIFTVSALSVSSFYVINTILGDSFLWIQFLFSVSLIMSFLSIVRMLEEFYFEASEFEPVRASTETMVKKVSVHIPSLREDVELLRQTITACLRQSYKNIEILLINNGSQTVEYEQSVQKLCQSFSDPRLKYIYFENVMKNKGAVLDFALTHTAKDADYIFILDADYQLKEDAINRAVSRISPEVSAVLYPQVYREGSNFIERMSRLEQQCIREFSQPFRYTNNTLIMNGTLCLIQKDVFETHAWNKKTICEDAMLGFELQMTGKKIVYVNEEIGVGTAPSNMRELYIQRIRWVVGAMQILKSKLFVRQAYTKGLLWKYLIGWLPWVSTVLPIPLVILYTQYIVFGLNINHLYLTHMPMYIYVGIIIVWFACISIIHLMRRLKLSVVDVVKCILFELALLYVVAIGVIFGLIFKNNVFISTRSGKSLLYYLSNIVACFLAVVFIIALKKTVDKTLYLNDFWTIFNTLVPVLIVCIPYVAYLGVLLVSSNSPRKT